MNENKIGIINFFCKNGTISIDVENNTFCKNILKSFKNPERIELKDTDVYLIFDIYSIINNQGKYNFIDNLYKVIDIISLLKIIDNKTLKFYLDEFNEFCDYENYKENILENGNLDDMETLLEIFDFIEKNFSDFYKENLKELNKLIKNNIEFIENYNLN